MVCVSTYEGVKSFNENLDWVCRANNVMCSFVVMKNDGISQEAQVKCQR